LIWKEGTIESLIAIRVPITWHIAADLGALDYLQVLICIILLEDFGEVARGSVIL
jgi:hypothetical protein